MRALPLFTALLLGGVIGFGSARLWQTISHPASSASNEASVASAILARPDPVQRFIDLTEFISRAELEASAGLVEAIEESPLDGGDPEVALFGLWWARFDPEDALSWTRSEWRARFGNVIAAVYRGWAQRAPEQALAQAPKTFFPVQRKLAIEAAVAGWDESGRAGLAEATAPLILGVDAWVGDVIARRRIGGLGPEGALRWLEAIENQELREAMVGPVVEAGAALEGAAPVMARWVEPRITGVDHRTGLPLRIAAQWVRYDPEAALAWLKALPAGVDRDDGVAGAFGGWMALDGRAAIDWAEHQPVERWNEPAMSIHARSMVVYGHAPEALTKVESFSNPDLRDTTTIQILLAWMGNDRDAAVAWLEKAQLSESVRSRIREMVELRREKDPALGGPSAANDDAGAAARPIPVS
jgi:hypothetical protein